MRAVPLTAEQRDLVLAHRGLVYFVANRFRAVPGFDREDLIGADHSLKMGWLSEFESFEDQEYGPRDFYQLTFNSPEGSPDFTTPYRVTIYNRPYISKDEQKHHGAYVSDQIRFVKNVTVNDRKPRIGTDCKTSSKGMRRIPARRLLAASVA